MEEKNLKNFLVLKITAFESETANSHNPEQNTCHWQSMFYEQPLRVNISLREIICRSGSLSVIKKYDENVLIQILYKFWIL